MASCPAHDDEKASLSIREKNGKVLVHCHAGCSQGAVLEALRGRDLWPERKRKNGKHGPYKTISATYDYEDECGEILFQAVRLTPKSFYQRRPNGKGGWVNNIDGINCVPYRQPDLIEAVTNDKIIFVVEGEKDTDTLAKFGIVATCNAAGAGRWRVKYAHY